MLCEKCGQREANVRFTEIVNGTVTEHNLCMECAGGINFGGYGALFDGESQLGRLLTGLLGFAGGHIRQEQEIDTSTIVCPVCHTSYNDFAQNSKFGCPDCYEVFDMLMSDHIKTIQGSEKHQGKVPMKYKAKAEMEKAAPAGSAAAGIPAPDCAGTSDSADQSDVLLENDAVTGPNDDSSDKISAGAGLSDAEKIEILKAKLKEALREEEYEMAAKYRDEIRALSGKGASDE